MNLTLYETRTMDRVRVAPPTPGRRKVSLLVDTSTAHGRGLVWGIWQYMSRHADWRTFIPEQRLGRKRRPSIDGWRGDAVITSIEESAVVGAMREWDVPTIHVSDACVFSGIPSVRSDDQTVATMAFEHLYEQGFRQLVYCHTPRGQHSGLRLEYFEQRAKGADIACRRYDFSAGETRKRELRDLISWLHTASQPTGILACDDRLGLELIEACRAAEILIPKQVAVIGVGNDELLCDLVDPPLSSIFPNAERIGFTAAEYLDRLLNGKEDVPPDTQVRPIGVVARASTDFFAVHDPDVAAAARFIREHAVKGIKVADILKVVPISRRALESRFRKSLGRTPHQEILGVQLNHVRALIRDTDLSLERIAARCGFRHVEYMSVVFKRELGQTPSEYRQSRS